jgi:hypothetical protein
MKKCQKWLKNPCRFFIALKIKFKKIAFSTLSSLPIIKTAEDLRHSGLTLPRDLSTIDLQNTMKFSVINCLN